MTFSKTVIGPVGAQFTISTNTSGNILAQFVTLEKLNAAYDSARAFNLNNLTIEYSKDSDGAIVSNYSSDVAIVPFSVLKQRFDATIAKMIEAGILDDNSLDALLDFRLGYEGNVFGYPAIHFANTLIFIKNIIDTREFTGRVSF